MSELTARRPAFDGQNLFFMAVLGLLSGSSRVRGLLERHGRASRGTAAVAPPTSGIDPVLASALGVVALRERLLAHVSTGLTTTSRRPPVAETGAAGATATQLRTLLR